MEDDEGAAEDERTIELSSIAAIYPEMAIDPTDPYTATLDLPVTPLRPLRIVFQAAAVGAPSALPTPPTSTEQGSEGARALSKISPGDGHQELAPADEHELSHLPPLSLRLNLPEGYPIHTPPNVSLFADPPWITPDVLNDLKGSCATLWEDLGKDQVVYSYIDHLQQASENAFGLGQAHEKKLQLSGEMKLAMLDNDLKTKRAIFEKQTFDCGVCLEPKRGVHCHRLMLCSHVFCITCLQDFYNDCIKGGDVDGVKCLDPGCGSDRIASPLRPDSTPRKRRARDRTLNPSELLHIPLEQEAVQRYVRLKRKKRLESDKNTIYCPRQWCQGAARSKRHPKPVNPFNDIEEDLSSGSEREAPPNTAKASKNTKDSDYVPMSERLAVCEDCDYAFCSVCKKTWHGELADCNPRRRAELNEEEKASMAYLQSFTTPCPTCSAPAQKTMGCNHMICFKCKTHFCYLCSAFLMPDNPYRHFNEHWSRCYMRLWELEGGDGMGVGHGYAGGNDIAAWEPDSDDGSDASSLSDDNGGPPEELFVDFESDDDADDDEPVPDQHLPVRNPNQIEIINFARQGGVGNQRIIHHIPERPQQPVPPPAPAAPARHQRQRRPNQWPGHGPLGHHQRGAPQVQQRGPPPAQPQPARLLGVAPPVDPAPAGPIEEANLPPGPPAIAAPGQGNNLHAGLDRFLALAERDEEDEWDSDELPDAEGFDEEDNHDDLVGHHPLELGLDRRVNRRRGPLARG